MSASAALSGPNPWRTYGAAAVLAAAIGAAPLVDWPPLAVPAALALAGITAFVVRDAVRALQFVTLVVLLPPGLLSGRIQFVLSGFALAVALVATVGHLLGTRAGIRFPASLVALVGFFIWSAMTLMWTPQTNLAIGMLRRYSWLILLTVVVVNVVTTRGAADRLLDALAVAAWIVIGTALWSLIASGYSAGSRLAVLGYNENQVGNVLLLLSIGVLWRAARPDEPHRSRRLVEAIAYFALCLIVIALTGSRGSIIGFALLGAMFMLQRKTRPLAALVGLVAVLAVIAAPSTFVTLDQRFTTASGELSRQTLWSSGTSLAVAHPWGVGLGYGPFAMRDYINARVSTDYFADRTSYPAHDPLIEVADDTGVPGLLLYTAAFVVAGRALWTAGRRRRRADDGYPQQLAVLIGIVSVAFLFVAAKSGGVAYDPTAFLLLALWLIPPSILQTDLRR